MRPTLLRLVFWLFGAAAVALASAPALANDWPPPKDKALTADDLQNPLYQPNDSDFPGLWQLHGYVPKNVSSHPGFRQQEVALGSGINADRAWQLSIGNAATTMAITDSGFDWGERDLVNKWRLNKGELPAPQDATGATCSTCADKWDVNGDGGFTVADFTNCKKGELPTLDHVTDKRLLARADKGDANGNGILDPQDLIAIFSDKKDDDGNGYVDDICGWDFLWSDNDPFDDVGNGGQYYSHGTIVARESGAEGNNGIGRIGSCPNCTILPLRASDSFIADSNHFAEAVVYAVDNGAASLHEALGSLNNTAFMQAAIDYAYAHGVPVWASAADEASFHHNYPGNAEHTLVAHAIQYDGASPEDLKTTSFLNFSNCSNWGAHVALSVPGGCATDAAALGGGYVGLIEAFSRELKLSPPLSTEEAYQVITQSADDIDIPESFADPLKFPSQPGFEPYFGYGRINARRSLEALRDGRIPPEVDVISPRWYEVVSPSKALVITGSIAAKRAQGFDWTVELAKGLLAKDADFKAVAQGSGKEPMLGVTLATADVSALFADATVPPKDPHDFTVYVRVRVTAHYGGAVGDVKGEFRKAFFVHRDPALLPAFPIHLGGSGESSPRAVDVNGDGKDEIVIAGADGRVHAIQADGSELPGFPVHSSPLHAVKEHAASKGLAALKGEGFYQPFSSTVAVGDLDGDGQPEIVAASLEGELYAWDSRGGMLAGFPIGASTAGLACFAQGPTGCTAAGIRTLPKVGSVTQEEMHEIQQGFFSSPVLYDLDGDGKREIVVAGLDGLLYAYRLDGTLQAGFPMELSDPSGGLKDSMDSHTKIRARIIATPAVGDVDGDGKPEILIGTNEVFATGFEGRGYLVKGTGAPSMERSAEAFFPGWPVKLHGVRADVLPFVGRGSPTSPVMIDADGDGKIDLLNIQTLVTANEFYDVTGRLLMTLESSTLGAKAGTQDTPVFPAINSGAVGDLDGDKLPEYVNGLLPPLALLSAASGGTRAHFDHTLGAWALGKQFKNSKNKFADPAYSATVPFLAAFPQKVDDHQFLTNYAIADVDGDGKAEALGGNGGYTIHAFTADGAEAAGFPKFTGGWVMATPAVGDVDGDGKLDLIEVTREGWLWAWTTKGDAGQALSWESFHHDAMSTGNTTTPLPTHGPHGLGANEPKKDDSGCGCSSSGGEALVFGAFGIVAMLRRRRAT